MKLIYFSRPFIGAQPCQLHLERSSGVPSWGIFLVFFAVLFFLYVIKKCRLIKKGVVLPWHLILFDGSEIRREHQLRSVVYLMIFSGFVHPKWCSPRISEPSTVGVFTVMTRGEWHGSHYPRKKKKNCQFRPFFIVGGGALGNFTHCFWCTRNTCLFWCSFVATCIKQGSLL